MKTNYSTTSARSVKWAAGLTAVAVSLIAGTVSAKDVPTKATSSGQTISRTIYPDGSEDSVATEVGVGTHVGRYTGQSQVHADPGQYDPGTHTFQIHFISIGISTAANRDTLSWRADGILIVPLDANGIALPPPYAFHSNWEELGGTGRFTGSTGHGTSDGWYYGDGSTTRIDTGVASTVGSNKK